MQGTVYALDLEYGMATSLSRHDNINLVNDPQQDEWVRSLRLDFSLEENSASVIANINASVEYLDYKYDQLEDAQTSRLRASTLFIVQPEAFEWHLSDVLTQSVINPLESGTPENRQDVNVFSSGPNLHWRLTSRSHIDLEARYQNTDYEDNISDNTREKISLRWNHDVNSALNFALNYEIMDVVFDNDSLYEITRKDAFASLSYRSGRNQYYAEAGATNIQSETTDDLDENRYMVSFESQRSRSSRFRIEARHDLSDTTISILDSIDSMDAAGTVFSIASSDIYVRDELSISYDKTWGIHSMEIQLADTESNYETSNDYDAQTKRGSISGSWGISGSSDVTLFVVKNETTYTSLLPYRKDDDISYGLRYRYSPWRNLTFNLEISSLERKSTIESYNYDDAVSLISVEYRS